jgi:hypothetical protein
VPADTCGQLHRGKRLDDDVHRASVERLDPGRDLGGSGQHDDRRAGFALLQHAEHVEPASTRHGKVEQDHVHVTSVDLVQRSLTIRGLADGVALGRERAVQDRADARLIVHHKHAGGKNFVRTRGLMAHPMPKSTHLA